jgi:hypothetical protein
MALNAFLLALGTQSLLVLLTGTRLIQQEAYLMDDSLVTYLN